MDTVPSTEDAITIKKTSRDAEKDLQFSLPVINDESSSESSEDDDSRPLYGKLPEDLGFTAVGMSFAEADLKIMQKLKLDFDTFTQMTEEEMMELGLKHGKKMKELVMNKEYKKKIVKHFPKQPKVNLQFSNSESIEVFTGILSETNDITQVIKELSLNFRRQLSLNEHMAKNQGDGEVLLMACKTVMRRAEQTQQLFERISKEIGLTLPVNISERLKKKETKEKLSDMQKSFIIVSGIAVIILGIKGIKALISPFRN